jgi:hypothetical protein
MKLIASPHGKHKQAYANADGEAQNNHHETFAGYFNDILFT